MSSYAYCNNNPLRFIDPTGMSYDDYFNDKGKYLGTDNSESDNIRIMDNETWEANKTGDNTIDPEVGQKVGVLHSQSGVSETVSYRIYSHYNPTNLSTIESLDRTFNMAYNFTFNKKTYKLGTEQMKINPYSLKRDGYIDKIGDIKNIFAHEEGHYNHLHEVGVEAYVNTSRSMRELRAMEAQTNHPTWNNVSDGLKRHFRGYAVDMKVYVPKLEIRPAVLINNIPLSAPLIIKK